MSIYIMTGLLKNNPPKVGSGKPEDPTLPLAGVELDPKKLIAGDVLFGGDYFQWDKDRNLVRFRGYSDEGQPRGWCWLSLDTAKEFIVLDTYEDGDAGDEEDFIKILAKVEVEIEDQTTEFVLNKDELELVTVDEDDIDEYFDELTTIDKLKENLESDRDSGSNVDMLFDEVAEDLGETVELLDFEVGKQLVQNILPEDGENALKELDVELKSISDDDLKEGKELVEEQREAILDAILQEKPARVEFAELLKQKVETINFAQSVTNLKNLTSSRSGRKKLNEALFRVQYLIVTGDKSQLEEGNNLLDIQIAAETTYGDIVAITNAAVNNIQEGKADPFPFLTTSSWQAPVSVFVTLLSAAQLWRNLPDN